MCVIWLCSDGANDGFHEAIGDTTVLSARVPRHLVDVGLLPAGRYVVML